MVITKRGEDEPAFGTLPELLEDFHQWISGDQPSIRNTQTFLIDDESSFLPVFLLQF